MKFLVAAFAFSLPALADMVLPGTLVTLPLGPEYTATKIQDNEAEAVSADKSSLINVRVVDLPAPMVSKAYVDQKAKRGQAFRIFPRSQRVDVFPGHLSHMYSVHKKLHTIRLAFGYGAGMVVIKAETKMADVQVNELILKLCAARWYAPLKDNPIDSLGFGILPPGDFQLVSGGDTGSFTYALDPKIISENTLTLSHVETAFTPESASALVATLAKKENYVPAPINTSATKLDKRPALLLQSEWKKNTESFDHQLYLVRNGDKTDVMELRLRPTLRDKYAQAWSKALGGYKRFSPKERVDIAAQNKAIEAFYKEKSKTAQ